MNSSRVDEAVNTFQEGLLCSQAILLTYGPEHGIDEDIALRIARSFGSGMGRTCQTCGAVTGAYMVLGLRNTKENEKDAKEETYTLIQEFARRFQELHGSVNCAQILGCNLGTPEGQSIFRSNNLVTKCKEAVRDAATILEDLTKRTGKDDRVEGCCSSIGCCSASKDVEQYSRTVTVDFLYLDLNQCGWCQGTEESLDNAIAKVSEVLKITGVELKLNKTHVKSEEQARRLGFTISPTIKVNGQDIQLNYKEIPCTSCSDLCGEDVECRVWLYQGKEYTTPPEEMIIESILHAVYGGSNDRPCCNPAKPEAPRNITKFFDALRRKTNG